MSKHNMTLAIPVNGGDDEIELVISYEFHREHGDYWNKGIGTWEPGEAASVEFLSAKRPSDVGPIDPLIQNTIDHIAQQWLESDDGQCAAKEEARDDIEADREEARERAYEERAGR